jgi:hypothetical protein
MCRFSPLGRTKRHPEGNYERILSQKRLKVKSGICFVSKYQLYLPSEEELRVEIERDVFELKKGSL